MSKIVSRSLSVLLGAFFIFLGVLKITPKISRDLHKDLRTEYAKYTKAFPLSKQLDFKVSSKWYRRGVGITEIVCGLIMVAVPSRRVKNAANVVLIGLKLLNAYSHWAISDEFERTAPTLVFLLMLGCRMVVDYQLAKREKEESAEVAAQIEKKRKAMAATASASSSDVPAAPAPAISKKDQ